jgi:hypothetical protein
MISLSLSGGWLEEKAYSALKPAAKRVLDEFTRNEFPRLVDTAAERASAVIYESIGAEIPALVDRALAEARDRVRLSPPMRFTAALLTLGIGSAAVFSFLAWRKRR